VTEETRGLGFFLATIDEDVAPRDLQEMHKSRIRLVVLERVKTCRDDYKAAANVITFENFFRDHLESRDDAMEERESHLAESRLATSSQVPIATCTSPPWVCSLFYLLSTN
jgi:hypothetical protein